MEANGQKQDVLWNANYIKVWMGNFLLHFSFTLIVPLLPLYLSDAFGADKGAIGLALSGYALVSLLVRPFSGWMVDSFPRKAVLIICHFLFFACFAGYLAAGSLTMFAIFRTLHGAPYGAATVSASTVAIDVLPSSRRAEGVGYYGLSSNLASALAPVTAIAVLKIFEGNFKILFTLSLIVSLCGLILDCLVKLPRRDTVPEKKVISLDRFFLLPAWRQALAIIFISFSWGVVSTYFAIYGKESLGMESGTGLFFSLCAIGLIISRLTGARSLRKGQITRNATLGSLTSLFAYLLFASVHNEISFYCTAFIIGLGNGHMYPAMQNMFINLAPNSQRGTANSSMFSSWDAGIGLGMLAGGFLAEHFGYPAAFWAAFVMNAIGVAIHLLWSRKHFEANKLR